MHLRTWHGIVHVFSNVSGMHMCMLRAVSLHVRRKCLVLRHFLVAQFLMPVYFLFGKHDERFVLTPIMLGQSCEIVAAGQHL